MKHKNNFDQQRQQMVDEQIRRRGVSDKNVLRAMETVPRHKFVDHNKERIAYCDNPLPIGEGQTISQPYIVAFMTEMLDLKSTHKVLEIGTGCGYQTAILSILANSVFSIEYYKELSETAKNRLDNLGYLNVNVFNANGFLGWETEAPYDRIICTAAPTKIPDKLIDQLSPSGIMVLPVGLSPFDQSLYMVKKDQNGKVSIERSLEVRFVPMIK